MEFSVNSTGVVVIGAVVVVESEPISNSKVVPMLFLLFLASAPSTSKPSNSNCNICLY